MQRLLKLLVFIILSVSSSAVTAQKDNAWELKKDEDGIKVFVRDKQGSKLKEIKVVTTFNSALSPLVFVLREKKEYKNWVYSCSESYFLKKINDTESFHYQVTDAPWPVDDRDLILYTVLTQNKQSKEVTLEAKGDPKYIEEKKGKVRVPDYYAIWKIKPVSSDKIEIEYFVSLDPGGSLPAWIINLGVSEAPYQTMVNLKKQLEKYKDKRLDYILEY